MSEFNPYIVPAYINGKYIGSYIIEYQNKDNIASEKEGEKDESSR